MDVTGQSGGIILRSLRACAAGGDVEAEAPPSSPSTLAQNSRLPSSCNIGESSSFQRSGERAVGLGALRLCLDLVPMFLSVSAKPAGRRRKLRTGIMLRLGGFVSVCRLRLHRSRRIRSFHLTGASCWLPIHAEGGVLRFEQGSSAAAAVSQWWPDRCVFCRYWMTSTRFTRTAPIRGLSTAVPGMVLRNGRKG